MKGGTKSYLIASSCRNQLKICVNYTFCHLLVVLGGRIKKDKHYTYHLYAFKIRMVYCFLTLLCTLRFPWYCFLALLIAFSDCYLLAKDKGSYHRPRLQYVWHTFLQIFETRGRTDVWLLLSTTTHFLMSVYSAVLSSSLDRDSALYSRVPFVTVLHCSFLPSFVFDERLD